MKIPILTYHAVLPIAAKEKQRGTVPLEQFREQMRWLATQGYASVSLDRLPGLLAGEERVSGRSVVITFDDGYRCVIEHALPVLEQMGLLATLFVVTDFVGGKSDWYVRKGGSPFEHATWDELADARARGFAVESHGVSHRKLTELDASEAREELELSRERIDERLGSCAHFAYPVGAATPAIARQALEAGYRTACTTERGRNARSQPLGLLRRQTISRHTDLRRLRRRLGRWL